MGQKHLTRKEFLCNNILKMKCRICSEERDTEFYKSNKSYCKSCLVKKATVWKKQNPDKVKEINHRGREGQSEYYRKWYKMGGRNRAENYNQIILLWQKNHPKECKVHYEVKKAIRKGELAKPLNCILCGKKGKINAHHDDYNKPFEILWVCSSCHKKIHLGLQIV